MSELHKTPRALRSRLRISNRQVWRNWCGNERVTPRQVLRPESDAEIIQAVVNAYASGRRVKAIGSGHSFTGAAVAPDVQIDLSDYTGVVGIDREKKQVTLRSGTKLWQIPALLKPLGLAMQNLGDINRQSILGAISTSTHGTGLKFASLSSQIAGFTIITGTGETLRVGADEPELLDALRVSVGAYGIVTEITLQLVDDFDLHIIEGVDSFSHVVSAWRSLCESHDHFEFFWFGHSDQVVTKTSERLHPHELPRSPGGTTKEFVSDEIIGNAAFAAVCQVGRFASKTIPALNKISTSGWGKSDRVKHWAEGFASPRRVRFRESEFAVPFDAVPEILTELQHYFLNDGGRATFPVEVRAAAADTGWLATNYGRETAYIAIHQHISTDHRAYFAHAQELFTRFGGRPHWGKMHTLDARDLSQLYPRWTDAMKLRDDLDPKRVFENRYIRQIFGS
jgi:FAD-linked oxidoreductase